MTTTQAPEKSPNAFQRGADAVIDLLSSFFFPIINPLVSVGILNEQGTGTCSHAGRERVPVPCSRSGAQKGDGDLRAVA